MTSKQLKKLTKTHENYDLSIDVMSTGKTNEYGVKAVLTIFGPASEAGKPSVVSRRTVGLGIATTLAEARDQAISDALTAAGIV